MDRPLLLAVDGNSLTHRAYHALAGTNLRDSAGRPTWAVKGFFSLLLGAIERIGPDAVVVGFDDSGNSRRKADYPDYKGTRGEKDDALRTQLALIPQLLRQAGIAVCVPPGLEADDITAAAARTATAHDWSCVIVTSDRDAFSHISDHVSVLRVLNGGIENSPVLNPFKFSTMVGIAPSNYLDYAALRGDASDNLPGVKGVGEKTAAKLLNAFGSAEAMWADVDGDGAAVVAATGKAMLTKLRNPESREAWARNRRLMAADPETTLDIDLSERAGHGHLPIAAAPVREALGSVQLASVVNRAVALLCPSEAPAHPQRPVWEPQPQTSGPPAQALAHASAQTTAQASEAYEYPPIPDEPPFDPEYTEEPPYTPVAGSNGLHPAAAFTGF